MISSADLGGLMAMMPAFATDDAADIIAELSDDQKEEVIAHLEDHEHAKEIVELLRYDEDTAGGLMAKELVKVKYEGDTYFPVWSDADWKITRTADHDRYEFRIYQRR